jgi:hypothetical protein
VVNEDTSGDVTALRADNERLQRELAHLRTMVQVSASSICVFDEMYTPAGAAVLQVVCDLNCRQHCIHSAASTTGTPG